MKNLKLVAFFMIGAMFLASCNKENVLEEEEVEYGMDVKVGTRSLSTDAYAVFCDSNGKSELRVSNNQELLEGDWDITTLAEGDYIFIQTNDGSSEFTLGGGFFSADQTGSGSQLSVSPDVSYSVDSNDGSTVEGSMSADMLIIGVDGNISSTEWSIEYVAEITGTSSYCD